MPAHTWYDFRLKLGSNFCFKRMEKKKKRITMLIEKSLEIYNVSIRPILAWQKLHGEKQGEPFQEDNRRHGSVRTLRLGPWHPEGQPTCRATPLGIDTTPYMINSAATYNKCCTVYMTYFKIEETQHACFSYFPLSSEALILWPRLREGTWTNNYDKPMDQC